MIAFEVLLPIGAVALYLVDSALFLFGNELAFERSTRWRCSPGSAFQFGGRRIFLPNPLLPGGLLFRVCWNPGDPIGMSGSLNVAELSRLIRPLRFIVYAQVFLLIVALAPIATIFGSGLTLLLLFALFYSLSIVSIGVLVARRHALRVSNRECVVLAFEMLACAPLAVNIVRKLTLKASPELPWIKLAHDEFEPAGRDGLESAIREQVELMVLDQEPGSEKENHLARFQSEIRDRLHGTRAG